MAKKLTVAHVVAEDNILISDGNPLVASDLAIGRTVTVIGSAGRPADTRVMNIERLAQPATGWRLLTALGDVIGPPQANVFTTTGPVSVAALAREVETNAQRRLELVDISAPSRSQPEGYDNMRAVTSACLGLVRDRRIVFPNTAGADQIVRHIADLLGSIGTESNVDRDERWISISFEPLFAAPSAILLKPSLAAEILMLVTSWPGADTTSRIVFQDHQLRRLLLAVLAASSRPYTVDWLPAYRPVECRFRFDRATTVRPFVRVIRALPTEIGVFRLELEDPGRLICDRALFE